MADTMVVIQWPSAPMSVLHEIFGLWLVKNGLMKGSYWVLAMCHSEPSYMKVNDVKKLSDDKVAAGDWPYVVKSNQL
jgi:hypothetical protein